MIVPIVGKAEDVTDQIPQYRCASFLYSTLELSSPAAESLLSRFRLRGTQGGRRYDMTRFGVPVELRGVERAVGVQSRVSWPFFKGLCFASPSGAAQWKSVLTLRNCITRRI